MHHPAPLASAIGPTTFASLSYQIAGELVPVLDITLGNEQIFFEHHILLWKDPSVAVGVKSLKGAFKRLIAGMSIFMTEAKGPGRISFSRDGVGQVFAIHLARGEEIEVREHQFLAATAGVEFTFVRVQGIANMFLGGTGFFIDRFSCPRDAGVLWLHGYGNVFEVTLGAGEQIDVEPGAWVYKDRSVGMETQFQRLSTGLFVLYHRKWLILGVFGLVSVVTAVITTRLPNIYSSDTLILVDPQRVPESYVKATISGDIRNRLGTLKQQILSATRLQKIIDNLNLYPTERKAMAREDVIAHMRSNIEVSVVSDFGGSQDLQAFRITYRGGDLQLVAQVANDIASQFIEENMKARTQQSEGTTEFLTSQLGETRKTLEDQEAKLRDFRLKHIGEMPEQEAADLQILGHLQSQLQLEADALNRAEQQRAYIESVMASSQSAGVVDLDDEQPARRSGTPAAAVPVNLAASKEKQLAELLAKGYTENHPDVRRLKAEIEQQAKNSKEPGLTGSPETAPLFAQTPVPPPPAPPRKQPTAPPKYVNPVLQTQLTGAESEIAKHKEQVQVLSKQIAGYQAKLEAIPVREQEITELVRDYEISKAHYSQLLNNQLSAATATQLEVRQKGEKFSILDPAQPAQKPSSPNRLLLNAGGSLGGLALGLFLALGTEFLGMSITSAEHVTAATGFPVLEVIPLIETRMDRLARRKRMFLAAASSAAVALSMGAFLVYYYRARFF